MLTINLIFTYAGLSSFVIESNMVNRPSLQQHFQLTFVSTKSTRIKSTRTMSTRTKRIRTKNHRTKSMRDSAYHPLNIFNVDLHPHPP